MWAPMLALQTPDPAAGFPSGTVLQPMLFLRNATAKNLRASIQLTWRGESAKGRAQLPEIRLKPFETRQLDIGSMQKQLGIPDDAHWALVTLTSPVSPDDLLATAASYDSTGRYGAQTPFSDNLGAYWAGGQWQVDATHNALVAVTNGGNRATKALLTLHFDDGRKNYEIQQTIQPGDQMWLNLADLIHQGVPDRKGNAFPADVASGTHDLEDLVTSVSLSQVLRSEVSTFPRHSDQTATRPAPQISEERRQIVGTARRSLDPKTDRSVETKQSALFPTVEDGHDGTHLGIKRKASGLGGWRECPGCQVAPES
jgi:hypothetical protein